MGKSGICYRATTVISFRMPVIILGVLVVLHPLSAAEVDLRPVLCPDGTASYVRCGRFNVPLDYSQPRGEKLSLWFAIVNGTFEGRKPQAIIILPGGPGLSSSLGVLPLAFNQSLAPNQPTVFLDLRGTGLSQVLVCSLQNNVPGFFIGNDPQVVAKCALELGPRRIHFNSANVARDVEVLRQKLAISQWNILGVSYGTQYATFYASLFPGSARTITLDSAFPLRRLDRGAGLYRAMLRSLRVVCERPSACSAEQVLKDLAEVLADLRLNPRDSLNPERLQIIMTFFATTTDTASALRAAKNGNYAALEALFSSLLVVNPRGAKNISLALSTATSCLESDLVWQPDDCEQEQLAKYESFILSSRPGAFSPFSTQEWIKAASREKMCLGWLPLPKGVRYQDLVPIPRGIIDTKGTPVLVVNGEIDLLTTLVDGRRAARQFKNRRFAVIANAGHSIIQKSPCGIDLMSEFIITGRYPQNTSRCADPATQPIIP